MIITSKIMPKFKIMLPSENEYKIGVFDGETLTYIHFNNKTEINSLISKLTELRDRDITKKKCKLPFNKENNSDNVKTIEKKDEILKNDRETEIINKISEMADLDGINDLNTIIATAVSIRERILQIMGEKTDES